MGYTFITGVSLLVIYLAVSVKAPDGIIHYDMDKAPELFEKFVKAFRKEYKNQEDRDIHFEYFKENLKEINELNARNGPEITYSINRFADMSNEELTKWYDDHQG